MKRSDIHAIIGMLWLIGGNTSKHSASLFYFVGVLYLGLSATYVLLEYAQKHWTKN